MRRQALEGLSSEMNVQLSDANPFLAEPIRRHSSSIPGKPCQSVCDVILPQLGTGIYFTRSRRALHCLGGHRARCCGHMKAVVWTIREPCLQPSSICGSRSVA